MNRRSWMRRRDPFKVQGSSFHEFANSSCTLTAERKPLTWISRLGLHDRLGDAPNGVYGGDTDGRPDYDLEPNRHVLHVFSLTTRAI